MKIKNLLIVFLILTILISNTNCRKGEDDPFFSIHTRKARLTNEWVLIEGSQTSTQTIGQSSLTFDYVITEDSISYFDGYENQTKAYSETLTFNKDETFSIKSEQEYFETNIFTTTHAGQWSFISSDGDYKNKERVKLLIETMTTAYMGQSSTTTYNQDDVSYILSLTKLSNDELNFDFDFTVQDATLNINITGTKKYVKK